MKRQKGFSLLELLIVVTIILIIATIAIPNMRRTRVTANETAAIATLQTLNKVCLIYSTTYGGFPNALSDLGPGASSNVSATQADLIDSVLASGTKSGYQFTYVGTDVNGDGKIDRYTINADPVSLGTSGQRYFFTDESGTVRHNLLGPATASDPPIG